MKKQGYWGWLKIHERERLSDRPFGDFTSKGKFKFNIERVPFYNVPDLTGFKLKAYVPHLTPRVPEDKYVKRVVDIDEEMLEEIERNVDAFTKGRLEKRGVEDVGRR